MTGTSKRAQEAIGALRRKGSKAHRDGLDGYGILTDKAFGVPMAEIQKLGKQLRHDHELALELWESGWYEARLLCAFIAEPERLTPAQMDRWTRDFDNWAVCDTLCFHLYDRSPHAWRKVEIWSQRRSEYVKRAGFALLAALALHDKSAADADFERALSCLERAAGDDRNFVKKGASWALRAIGRRRPGLKARALALASRFAASDDPAARWIGKDALRDLNRQSKTRA